jgi:hypothetical protein
MCFSYHENTNKNVSEPGKIFGFGLISGFGPVFCTFEGHGLI